MNYIVVYRGIFKLRSCKININVIIIRHTHDVQYLGLTQRSKKDNESETRMRGENKRKTLREMREKRETKEGE